MYLYIIGLSPPNIQRGWAERDKQIFRKELARESLEANKSETAGQANGLKTQVRVEITILTLKSTGKASSVKSQTGFLHYS
jgi:hypothetical protein